MALLLTLYDPGDPIKAERDIGGLTVDQYDQLVAAVESYFSTAGNGTTKQELHDKVVEFYNDVRAKAP